MKINAQFLIHTFFPSRLWTPWAKTFSTLLASQKVTNPKPLEKNGDAAAFAETFLDLVLSP